MSSRRRADGTVGAATAVRPGRARVVAGTILIVAAAGAGLLAVRSPAGTPAWVLNRPVAAAAAVTQADLVPAEVVVPDATMLWPGATPPEGTATRPLAPGQPLMAADLTIENDPDARSVSLSLPPERLPQHLQIGDQVDVWLGAGNPRIVLAAVAVAGIAADPALATRAQVDVLVAAADAPSAVEAALAEDLVLVRRP